MHARQLSFSLVLCFSFLVAVPGAYAQVTKSAKSVKVDVYKEFQDKLDSLEKNLAIESNISKRYDLFLTTYADLVSLRKAHPRQAESKEINMSLFFDALAPFPAKKDFSAKKCPQYVKDVQGGMKSYQNKDSEISVIRANKLAQLICK